jgi:hypothetical protein
MQPEQIKAPMAESLSSAELLRIGKAIHMTSSEIGWLHGAALKTGYYNHELVNRLAPVRPNFGGQVIGFVNKTVLGLKPKDKAPTLDDVDHQLRIAEAVEAGQQNFGEGHQIFVDRVNTDMARICYYSNDTGLLTYEIASSGQISKIVEKRRVEMPVQEILDLRQSTEQMGEVVGTNIYPYLYQHLKNLSQLTTPGLTMPGNVVSAA